MDSDFGNETVYVEIVNQIANCGNNHLNKWFSQITHSLISFSFGYFEISLFIYFCGILFFFLWFLLRPIIFARFFLSFSIVCELVCLCWCKLQFHSKFAVVIRLNRIQLQHIKYKCEIQSLTVNV